MPKYVLWGTYCEDVLEKRAPHRQAHLDGLAKQKESGVLITIGPHQRCHKSFWNLRSRRRSHCTPVD